MGFNKPGRFNHIPTVGLEGDRHLVEAFRRYASIVNSKQVVDEIQKTGEFLRDTIKARTPVGPTGNLRRSIVAKKFKHNRFTENPATFVGIDYKIGPHAHLLEFGTVFMAAKPFFRSTVHEKSNDIHNRIARSTWRIIELTAKKSGRRI
jgi:HK97 gp10 family phage protein